jgi:stage III sporulation protein AE
MPRESGTFGEDLWYIIKSALGKLQPDLTEAMHSCISLTAVIMLVSLLQTFTGTAKRVTDLACTLSVSIILIQPANSLIQLGMQTVGEISEYGKLLIPVMTAAMAAEGGVTTSAALYTATIAFNTMLTAAITKLIIPMIYIYIVLCIATSAISENLLKQTRDFIKWLMTWALKISIYLFTGYLGITGVISGTADASAIKAAKLAINGFVPVVGNIISDASETILVSAGVMKSSVGIYGMLVILATWISPFLRIGAHYILLKITSCVCGVFGTKESVGLIEDFSGIMGFILAITGTVCLLLLISTVCFMKGVA